LKKIFRDLFIREGIWEFITYWRYWLVILNFLAHLHIAHMVCFGYLQVMSLIMYLIGLYQGKLRRITDCEYVCSFSENYQYCYFLVSLCWICTIFHPLLAEREDRWVGGTICGSGWTSCRFVSCAYFENLTFRK
jgi:hypothetical protein